jgi:hypothetical protein
MSEYSETNTFSVEIPKGGASQLKKTVSAFEKHVSQITTEE